MLLDMKGIKSIKTADQTYEDVYDIDGNWLNGVLFYKFEYIARTPGGIEGTERRLTAVRTDLIESVEYNILETAKGRDDRLGGE